MWKRSNAWSLPILIARSSSPPSRSEPNHAKVPHDPGGTCDHRLRPDIPAGRPIPQKGTTPPGPPIGRPGDHSQGEPPEPIPNSAVKPLCAYGTASPLVGESVVARPSNRGPNPCLFMTPILPCRPPGRLESRIGSIPIRPFGLMQRNARQTEGANHHRGVEQPGSSSGS